MTDSYHLNALPPGTWLQEYEVERVLGEGSFGIVYLARDKYLEHQVAIKEYLPRELATRIDGATVAPTSTASEKNFAWGRQKFLEEARLLNQLATPQPHPNIVAVRRFFEQHGTAYLVMDFEQGAALSEVVRLQGRLPPDKLAALMTALLEGLEAIHTAGIVHRDIKPDNILIRPDGTPVFLDFGAARLALGERTQSAFNAMSPAYAALEQHMGDERIGPWTDIYGLGATLYRAVTGALPQTPLERMAEAKHRPAAEIADEGYEPHLLAAIDTALTLKPDERPQSVAEWRLVLAGTAPEEATVLLGRQAAQTRSEAPTQPAPRSKPGHGGLWLGGLAAGVALLTLAGVFLYLQPTGDPTPARQAPQPQTAAPDPDFLAKQEASRAAQAAAEEATRRRVALQAELLAQQAGREAAARQEAERQATLTAEEEARREAEEQAALAAAEESRRLAEETARREAEATAQRKAEEEAKRLAAEAAQREAEEARRQAAAAAQREAEEAARREAEAAAEEAKRLAAAAAQREAKEAALREAELATQRAAEAEAERLAAAAAALNKAEEAARQEAALAAQRAAEAEARRLTEAEAAGMVGAAAAQLGDVPQQEAARPAEAAILVAPRDERWIATGAANVRAAPATDGQRLVTLSVGQAVRVTGGVVGRDWLEVALADGRKGFVWAPLLTRPGEAARAAPVAKPALTAAELAQYLAANRDVMMHKLTVYNRQHRVMVPPSGDIGKVKRLYNAEVQEIRGNRFLVTFNAQVTTTLNFGGPWSGREVFELRLEKGELNFVDHQVAALAPAAPAAGDVAPDRSRQQVEAFLKANRWTLMEQLTNYNRDHHILVAPNGLTKIENIVRQQVTRLVGERVWIESRLSVGQNYQVRAGNFLIEYRWIGEQLIIVSHQKL